MERQGLFIGLVTLDLAYLVDDLPNPDQKMLAQDFTVAAGGPATNAAVAFSYLGNRSWVIGSVGSHPAAQMIRSDLEQCQVELIDITSNQTTPPTISSILIRKATGDRTVVYTTPAAQMGHPNSPPLDPPTDTGVAFGPDRLPSTIPGLPNVAPLPSPPPHPHPSAFICVHLRSVPHPHILLIDGHQMSLSEEAATHAKANTIPIVVDGGSWKPGFEKVLALTDYAICSADFFPPGCKNSAEVMDYLRSLHIPHIAITQGAKPILYSTNEICGEIPVPPIQPVDTLGAGDIFHGAFCDTILRMEFREALGEAGAIAARSCLSFGTRAWMHSNKKQGVE